MSETAPESIVVTNQGVMTGVEPPARVPSINTTTNTISSTRSEQPAMDPEKVFTVADVEKARQQEKDKMYSRLEQLQEQVRTLSEEREQRLTSEQQAQQQAEEDARRQTESETDVRTLLQQKEAEWAARLEQEKQERERAFALLDKEREFAALESYKQQQVRAHEDDILPELLDEVTGATSDEIDASIARLVTKTQSILENVGAVAMQQRQAQPSARVTAPPVGPLESETAQRQLSAEEIAQMPMSEYAKNRDRFGVTGGSTHRGLFG